MENDVSAVIVTYRPDPAVVEQCLARLEKQVGHVYVVDNGSSEELLADLSRRLAKFANVSLERNGYNAGLAAGLTIGVRHALQRRSAWVLTLDDDSLVPADMIKCMLAVYQSLPEARRAATGILAPNYATIKGKTYSFVKPTAVVTAITSGQLVRADLFVAIGFFKEDLFIECIDHEFCLRAKQNGFETLLIPGCVLEQRIGHPVLKNWLGKKFVLANHQPFRYYYIFRNSVRIYIKYWCMVPGWVLRNIGANVILLAKVILLEENKRAKVAMAFRGVLDGLRGRLGMRAIADMKR